MNPPMHRLLRKIFSLHLPLASVALQLQTSPRRHQHAGLVPRHQIERVYAPYEPSRLGEERPLHRVLCEIDPLVFPTPSQARRAIQHGRLMVLPAENGCNRHIAKDASISDEAILDLGLVCNSTTTLRDNDILAVRSRVANKFYPQYCITFVDPPPNAAHLMSNENAVVFEDDAIAVVNKPEWIETIGEKRQDLQSILPFVLRPPSSVSQGMNTKQPCYLPRPIHRLDRRTSGCVLVAKSAEAMKQFSRLFADRRIQKSYHAVTFGEPTVGDDERVEIDGEAFHTIDYPIDGKDAVTLWRTVATTTHPLWGKVSLLHLLPKTGRTHQLRRHLAYCLSCPIVGDSKYDGGGKLAREARGMGMFLCSDAVEFEHVMSPDRDVVKATVPLPDRFYEIMGVDNEGGLK